MKNKIMEKRNKFFRTTSQKKTLTNNKQAKKNFDQ